MDVLFLDPLNFSFKIESNNSSNGIIDTSQEANLNTHITDIACHSDFPGKGQPMGSILSHDLTPLEILVHNNTTESIRMILSITFRDVAGENCFDGSKATILWDGVLSGIEVEVPPLGEAIHPFVV